MRYKVKILIVCTTRDCTYRVTKRDTMTELQLEWIQGHQEYTGRCPQCRKDGCLIADKIDPKTIESTPLEKIKPQYLPGIKIGQFWKQKEKAR